MPQDLTIKEAPIRLAVSDTGNRENPLDSAVGRLFAVIAEHFDLTLCPFDEADYLLYGDFGTEHTRFDGVKIFFTGENHAPRFSQCDYAFTHELFLTERHMRLPIYALPVLEHPDWLDGLLHRPVITPEQLATQNRKFCNFVYRNDVCKVRNNFFRALSKYRPVDSGGLLYNNIGYRVGDNFEFQKHYKFTIAFENESYPGYTTEKLFDALRARTLPIYWGNPLVANDFNPLSYLNYFDFDSEKELIDAIVELDHDDDLYLRYLNAPMLYDSAPRYLDSRRIFRRFEQIFRIRSKRRTAGERFLGGLDKYLGRSAIRRLQDFSRHLRGDD